MFWCIILWENAEMFLQKCCLYFCFLPLWCDCLYLKSRSSVGFDVLLFICSFTKGMCWASSVSSLRWDQAAEIHRDQDLIKYDYVEVGTLLALRLQRLVGLYGSLQRGVSIWQKSWDFFHTMAQNIPKFFNKIKWQKRVPMSNQYGWPYLISLLPLILAIIF